MGLFHTVQIQNHTSHNGNTFHHLHFYETPVCRLHHTWHIEQSDEAQNEDILFVSLWLQCRWFVIESQQLSPFLCEGRSRLIQPTLLNLKDIGILIRSSNSIEFTVKEKFECPILGRCSFTSDFDFSRSSIHRGYSLSRTLWEVNNKKPRTPPNLSDGVLFSY